MKTIDNRCNNISYPWNTTFDTNTTIENGFRFFNFKFNFNPDCPIYNWTIIDIYNSTRTFPTGIRKNGNQGRPDLHAGVCSILFGSGFDQINLYLLVNHFDDYKEGMLGD